MWSKAVGALKGGVVDASVSHSQVGDEFLGWLTFTTSSSWFQGNDAVASSMSCRRQLYIFGTVARRFAHKGELAEAPCGACMEGAAM
jgi:hypothetical protein